MGGLLGIVVNTAPSIAASPACTHPLSEFIPALLADLPSYTNRAALRQLKPRQSLTQYLLLAGNPEYQPLPLSRQQWEPSKPDTTQQVFFSTFEHHYDQDQRRRQQNFYWAFFVETPKGWELTLLYEQPALSPNLNFKFLRPPQAGTRREVSQMPIGQGIALWLRDCRAGRVGVSRFTELRPE